MHRSLNKVAAVLAFVFGWMAIFAGGKVLLGNAPGYNVISWLPLYNYTIGVLTVFVTFFLIWFNHKLALPFALLTFSIHAIIMFILQIFYRDVVAMESISAMLLRLTTWFIINLLILVQARKTKLHWREHHHVR